MTLSVTADYLSSTVVMTPFLCYFRTGLLFDPAMLSHICLCPHGNNPHVHPENPLRIISILERIAGVRLQIPPGLLSPGEQDSKVAIPDGLPLAFFCKWMRARMATRVSDNFYLFDHTPVV